MATKQSISLNSTQNSSENSTNSSLNSTQNLSENSTNSSLNSTQNSSEKIANRSGDKSQNDDILAISQQNPPNFAGGRYDPFFMGEKLVKVTRGFGYWCWKPQVILQSLRQIEDGDILIYADIGFEFVKSGAKSLLEKLKMLDKHEIMGCLSPDYAPCSKEGLEYWWVKVGKKSMQSPLVKHDEKGYYLSIIEKTWTKMDMFKHFGVENDPKFTDTAQIGGAPIFMKKCKKAEQIMREWRDVFWNNFELINDSPSKAQNFEDFIENRHDQSAWSIINKKHNLTNFAEYYAINGDKLAFGMLDSRKSWDTMGHLFNFDGTLKANSNANLSITSHTLKRFIRLGGRLMPSKKARIQCRKLKDLFK